MRETLVVHDLALAYITLIYTCDLFHVMLCALCRFTCRKVLDAHLETILRVVLSEIVNLPEECLHRKREVFAVKIELSLLTQLDVEVLLDWDSCLLKQFKSLWILFYNTLPFKVLGFLLLTFLLRSAKSLSEKLSLFKLLA
jgi:hypothetical protein